jgi:hypothetical protein
MQPNAMIKRQYRALGVIENAGPDGLGRAGADELGEIPTHGAFHERHFVSGMVAVRIAWPEEVPMAAQPAMDLIARVEARQLIHHSRDRAGGRPSYACILSMANVEASSVSEKK